MSATEFLDRRCPVCDEIAKEPGLKKGELQLYSCAACGMSYASPVPRALATGEFYDEARGYYLSEDKLANDYSPVRFERELRIFTRYVPNGRVLDVGCSTGAFLFQLKERGYDVLGADVVGPALDHAESRGIPVVRGNFLEQRFERPFDAITFWAVLEHVVAPKEFLAKAVSVLKPGGHCFVLVPNGRSLATRILGAKYRYILPEHVNYFTAHTLNDLCSQHFRVEKITSTHFNPVVIVQDFRAGREPKPSDRATLLKKTTAMKQSAAFYPLRMVYKAVEGGLSRMMLADNLVAVLRKN